MSRVCDPCDNVGDWKNCCLYCIASGVGPKYMTACPLSTLYEEIGMPRSKSALSRVPNTLTLVPVHPHGLSMLTET